MSVSQAIFPIAIVEDRYGGAYSGGAWLAIARADEECDRLSRADYCLNEGPGGGDGEAAVFWSDPPAWIAVGATPDAALTALLAKAAGAIFPPAGDDAEEEVEDDVERLEGMFEDRERES